MLGRFGEAWGSQNEGQNRFLGRFFLTLFSNACLEGFGRRVVRVVGMFFGHVFKVLHTDNCTFARDAIKPEFFARF